MKISESLLRRIVRSELLRESAVTPEEADRKGVTFTVKQSNALIEIIATRRDETVGVLRAEMTRDPCADAWEITRSKSKIDGMGPLLYDLMIDLVSPDPLTSDRGSVSADAKRVWDYYMSRRPDIESIPLDNRRNERTPEPDDNCIQASAMMWSNQDGKPWHELSLARAYKRADGGTPMLDALDDLGIIEFV